MTPKTKAILYSAGALALWAIGTETFPTTPGTWCKSSLLGVCTSRFTPAEQEKISSEKRLQALLSDPATAAPELERRLRQQVRYYNGVLLIEDPILHSVTALPATTAWSISCDAGGVQVNFGDTSDNGSGAYVEITPIGIGAAPTACKGISARLGTAVLRLTRGE
jgi:hypothetical protein